MPDSHHLESAPAITPTAIHTAHAGLTQGRGSILRTPTHRQSTDDETRQARTIVATVHAQRASGKTHHGYLIEDFPYGTLALVPLDDPTFVVLLITDTFDNEGNLEQVTALTCEDPTDADHIYNQAAIILNLLGNRCAGCGTPISNVFEICPDCA